VIRSDPLPYTDVLSAWEWLGGKLRDRVTLETTITLDEHCGVNLIDVDAMRAYAERVLLNQLRIVQATPPTRPPLIPGLPRK
jgi:hypothetical protein